MRARLALAVSGQALEHREVVLRAKPAEMLAASPKGTVPVLVLPGGQVIEESLDIMRWALQQHDPQDWLSADRELMASLIAANDGPFKRSLDRYKYPNRYAGEHAGEGPAFALAHRNQAATWLRAAKPILVRMRSACPSAVRREITNRSAICRLVMPYAISSATSNSRRVSPVSGTGGAGRPGRRGSPRA